MRSRKIGLMAGALTVGLVLQGAPASASGVTETTTPSVRTAELAMSDALGDSAMELAEGMGATLSRAATGTWTTMETVSGSVARAVSTTWDQTMQATLVAAVPPSAGAEGAPSSGSMGLLDLIGRGWNELKGLFGRSATVAAPSSTTDWLKELNADHQTGFWTLLGDAGYSLQEIETTIGLIPEVEFQYTYTRQLSEADKAWLERKLDHLARTETGPVSAIQRAIIHGILEGNEADGFIIEEVKISLLPLPEAKFAMSPLEKPLPEDLDRIYRAVIGKKRRSEAQ